MFLLRFFGKLLVGWLFVTGFASHAENIHPRLTPADFNSLHRRLQASRPDTSRVQLLLHLSQGLLAQADETGKFPTEALPYCQQAAALSERLHFDAGRIGSLYVLGEYQLFIPQDTLGPHLFRQGLALSQRLGNRQLAALGWYWVSYDKTGAVQLALLQRSLALFRQVHDPVHAAYVLKCIADVHQAQDQSAQAVRELLEVEALYRAAGHRKLFHTYDLLLATYRRMGDYKEALRYGLAALDNAHATQDSTLAGGLYVHMAVLHRELKQYPEALHYYHKALVSMQQTGDSLNVVTMAGAIVRVLVAQHRAPEGLAFFTRATRPYATQQPRVVERIADYMVELYSALGRYQQAEPYVAQLVAFLRSGKADNGEKTAVYSQLSRFYLLTKRYDAARQYLQESVELNRHGGSPLQVAELHRLLFKVDSAQARFPAAIAHYQRYKQLTDSVFNERKSKQLATLQVQYDTHQKEQNIALLTKQAQLQQARLLQREWQRNAGLAGAALLAMLLGLGYNRYRLKQRSNQRLQAQQLEINHKNESLEQLVSDKQVLLEEKQGLLEEKDWMLKEIHHRVKNNLQVVSSLLNTQADYLRDPAALAALRESQNRVQAIALVHQKLYQSDSVALVNMPEYIREITERLLESFDCLDTVREHLDIAPVELDVALATPLGLVLNEAITNALKHAFPQRRAGRLTISLHAIGERRYELRIADDGVGLPPGFDPARSQSLGLTMITGLSKQLSGALRIEPAGPGVQVILQFEVARKSVRMEGVLA
ncbi:MAG: histidine kinase dimerization/phosphoacceptor domain -containing protein [Janthinobacterium lividum]